MPLRFRPLLGFVIVLAAAAVPSSARAIVNGELAGGQYPAVGTVVVAPGGGEPMFHPCSGFLISSTAFATAGHCVVFVQELQDEVGRQTIGVSFDPTFDPDTSSFVEAASATIHPEFLANQHSNKTSDMAVLALKAPIEGVEPIELPEQGAAKHLSHDSQLTTVGYGMTRDCTDPGPCQLVDEPARRFATETLNSVSRWFITVGQNPASGEGGVCYMDSGGPHLLPGTNTAVALTSAVHGSFCSSTSRDVRIDTARALSFLKAQRGPSHVCAGRKATIVGTDRSDKLRGTNGDDVIAAGGGDDRVVGLKGDDLICAAGGADVIQGGAGDDVLRAGAGDDKVKAGGGDDKLRGKGGDDLLRGQGGEDVHRGGGGDDDCRGGRGSDSRHHC